VSNEVTPVTIMGAYAHLGLGLVRSLGRMGIPVYVLDRNLDAPAFYSRYCTERFRHAKTLVDLLDIGCKIGQKSVLIPTDDQSCLFVAENSHRLRARFIFPEVETDLVRSLVSKKELYNKAKLHGVPTAEISFPQSKDELDDFMGRHNFPIVAKAIHGWQWDVRGGKTAIIKSPRELIALYNLAYPNLILQEYIPGGNEADWIFNGYFNAQSECLFGYSGKKIRQWPPQGGITTLGVCSRNKSTDQSAKEFLASIGYRGIVDMDFRYDARDGKYKLLDVNPRVGSTFRLFVSDTGIDVARSLYNDLTGKLVRIGDVPDGRKWMAENFDLLAILSCMRRRELTLARLRDSFVGLQETAYFAADDPIPYLFACNRSFVSAAISSLFFGKRKVE